MTEEGDEEGESEFSELEHSEMEYEGDENDEGDAAVDPASRM